MKNLLYFLVFLSLIACDPSSIRIENRLANATITNVEWGGIPIATSILPGERSSVIKIHNNNYYDIDLPAKFPVKFYISVNDDLVYLETREYYELGVESDLVIAITDSTAILNPLLEDD